MRYLIFSFLVLNLAACCADDWCETYLINYTTISFDTTTNHFTPAQVDSSRILIINKTAQAIVETYELSPASGQRSYDLIIEREMSSGRDMREHIYVIEIDNISDTINDFSYTAIPTETTCYEGCFPRISYEAEYVKIEDFKFTYRNEEYGLYSNLVIRR